MRKVFELAAFLMMAAVLVSACGGASEAGSGGGSARGMPSECPQPPFDFEIRRDGTGSNEVFTAVAARADMQLERRFYKLYLTSYPLDPERSLLSQVMTKPPGGTVVQVGVQTDYGTNTPSIEDWTPLKAGDLALEIHESRKTHGEPTGQPIMTFSIADEEGSTAQATSELEATAKVLYVGADGICLDVQATSERGLQISGIVAGPVL